MNRHLLISLFVVAIIITAVVVRLRGQEDAWLCRNGQWVKYGNPSSSIPTLPCVAGETADTANDDKKGTTTDGVIIGQPNIFLTLPAQNSEVPSIFRIEGQARVFENTLAVRVSDSNGRKILEKTVMSQAPDAGMYGPFTLDINLKEYPDVLAGKLVIEAFQYSAKDGSEIDKTAINVQYTGKEDNTSVKVYFNNAKLDPSVSCEAVFPSERKVPKTSAVARAAIEELLKGPNEAETAAGYTTSLNKGIKLQKITIEDGVAKVDFDKNLDDNIGGSCKVSAIRAQITKTLEQFSSVKDVVISIDGRTEEILQP